MNVTPDNLRQAVETLFQELFFASPDPKQTWVVANEPNSGLLGTLRLLPAEIASHAPRPNLHTVAAHAAHLLFATENAITWLSGQTPTRDWETSWQPATVDDAQWRAQLDKLESTITALRTRIAAHTNWDLPSTTGLLGTLAHTAYHLGCIRQLAHWHRK